VTRQSYGTRRRLWGAWLVSLLVVSPVVHPAPRVATTVSYGTRWHSLTATVRGTRVLLVQDLQSSITTVGLQVHVGYYSDPAGISGLAHFVEHMIVFSPTQRFAESIHAWRGGGLRRFLRAHTDTTYTDYIVSSDVADQNELAARLMSSLSNQVFSETTTQRVLRDIEQEYGRFSASAAGVLENAESTLASEESPFRRLASAGGAAELKTVPVSALTEAARSFAKQHYQHNISTIVVVSPRPVEESLELVRSMLQSDEYQPASDPGSFDAPAFGASTAGPHPVRASGSTGSVRLLYELPPLRGAAAYWTYRLIDSALASADPSSLASEVKARGLARSTDVDTDPMAFGTHGAVRIDFDGVPPGSDAAVQLGSLVRSRVKEIRACDQDVQFPTIDELSRLVSRQPARGELVKDLLDDVAVGADGAALDYRARIPCNLLKDLPAVSRAFDSPLVLLVSAASETAKPNDAAIQPAGENGRVARAPSYAALTRVATCIEQQRTGNSACLSSLWSAQGLRLLSVIQTPLDRSLVKVLLDTAADRVRDKYGPLLAQSGGGLEVFANTWPAIGAYGPPALVTGLVDDVRTEFLRRRTADEVQDLHNHLASVPRESFYLALQSLDSRLGIFDNSGAAQLTPDQLSQSVARLQEMAGAAQSDYLKSPRHPSRPPNVDAMLPPPDAASLPNTIASPSSVSSFVRLWCGRPTSDLQLFRRAAVLPLHARLWSQAALGRDSDPDAFGVFLHREAGPYMCYGNALDSGILQRQDLQRAAEGAIERARTELCALSPAGWEAFRREYLIESSVSWSFYQQESLDDLYNWLEYGDSLAAAHANNSRAERLNQSAYCELLSRGLDSLRVGYSAIVGPTDSK
jgi:hypothetical protein